MSTTPQFEIPTDLRKVTEQSIEQVRIGIKRRTVKCTETRALVHRKVHHCTTPRYRGQHGRGARQASPHRTGWQPPAARLASGSN